MTENTNSEDVPTEDIERDELSLEDTSAKTSEVTAKQAAQAFQAAADLVS